MMNEFDTWLQTIPTFKNQQPRTLDSFRYGEQFEDDLFPATPDSLISQNTYQTIINNYISNPNDASNKAEKKTADILNSVTVWKRISDLFPTSDLFPPELHCDNFKQGQIGDCYFIDMIALLSNQHKNLITRLFPIKKNSHGYYEVILFINGWKRVIVDDYIPLKKYEENEIKLLGCESKTHQNCFYFMLLEKAWAKVNGNYYNIYGGNANESLLVLTGFDGEKIYFNNNPDENRKNGIIEDLEKGHRRYGNLFAINDYGHSYTLLDVRTYLVNGINYKVLQARNPWGIVGAHIFDTKENNIDNAVIEKFKNRRDIVEDELVTRLGSFNQTIDNGIFYISKKYFFQLFRSYSKCHHFFGSTFIEFLLKFNLDNINKRFFMFKLIVAENSLVQLNLTKHSFNNDGQILFNHYSPDIKMNPFVSNDICKKIPPGEYYIEWHYNEPSPPEEILFWVIYQGKIELVFLGMSNQSEVYKENFNFNSNEGLVLKKNSYKIDEKLGEAQRRKEEAINFLKNTLNCNINGDEEDRGYSLSYQENDNIAFSFVVNKEDISKSIVLSRNLDFPEFYFQGNHASYRRVLGEGKIYLNNRKVYQGHINYNLFPQKIQENDDENELIIDYVNKRFKLSQEIDDNELTNLNVRKKGPFEGQLRLTTHVHALTKCITPERSGWRCDHCNKSFGNREYSFYCTICDFDYCGQNCLNPYKTCRNMSPHLSEEFQFKTLQHLHPLVKIERKQKGLHSKCFSCLKNIPDNEYFYYCTSCDFRLCEKCKIIESREKPFQFITSWHEHPLTFCMTKGYIKNNNNYNKCKVEILEDSEFFFRCNHCGIEYSRKKDTFYCTACDFYICMKCYKDYFFFIGRDSENAVEINMGNSNVYPALCRCYLDNTGDIKFDKCKKCNARLELSKWTYYCSNCNSNFCIYCYRSHKVIFENNILIFDGNFNNTRKNGFGITYKNNNDINYDGNWLDGKFPLMKNIEKYGTPL